MMNTDWQQIWRYAEPTNSKIASDPRRPGHFQLFYRCATKLPAPLGSASCLRANCGGSPILRYGGSALPRFAFTCEASLALIVPLALMSDRKFVASIVCPMRDLVCDTSPAFTAPL